MALKNRPGVSEETRRKILELKNKHSKENKNSIASKTNKGNIDFLVYKKHGTVITETNFFVKLIEAINLQAQENSYSVNISYCDSSQDMVVYFNNVNRTDNNGLFILATEMESKDIQFFESMVRKPTVYIDAYFPCDKVDCVLMDNQSGITQSMKYGISLGHREIGFINGKIKTNNFEDRFESFKRCMSEYGLQYKQEYIYSLTASIEEAYEDMLERLRNVSKLPTLFIAANDILAIGAANALKKANYSIPDDISIIGFDDMPISRYLDPPLTSVMLRHEVIGMQAVKRLIEKIEKPETAEYCLGCMVGVDLMPRCSVKNLNTL